MKTTNRLKFILFSLVLLTILPNIILASNDDLKFLIAGHAYGKPLDSNIGINNIFFDSIKTENVDFGILIGDSVRKLTNESKILLKNQVNELNYTIYFTEGNHDKGINNLFNRDSYYSLVKNNNLFLFLSSEKNNSCINNNQFNFIENEINKSSYANILIFIHQVIWVEEYSKLKITIPNSYKCNPDVLNRLKMILKNHKSYIFTGDLGCNLQTLFYDKSDNVTYIGTGIGQNWKKSNYLIATIKNNNLSFEVISLDGEEYDEIESYNYENSSKNYIFKLIVKKLNSFINIIKYYLIKFNSYFFKI